MTNHWTDMDNSSLFLVFGANPAENHPASMAHINAARFGTKSARLIVVDPRLTRTARQVDPTRGDAYVRIRPGTNVAFTNGLLNWIFNNIASYKAQTARNMVAWHNGFVDPAFPSDTAPNSLHVSRTFCDDAGATVTFSPTNLAGAAYDSVPTTALANGYPKYCDSRFKIAAAGDDYLRGVLTVTATTGDSWKLTDFPVLAADVTDADSVYQKLKAHVAPYDTATVSDICGCTEADIAYVAKALIDNSRFASSDFGAGTATPTASTYKVSTILYAMGQTQHTNGSQNIKDLAVIQTLMGNMGRAGGGINALRGIHNVQGSTDMGLLFDSIPGYSGNPADGETYSHYLNAMYGNRINVDGLDSTGKDYTVLANLGLQQRGFHNMTQEWFGDGAVIGSDMATLWTLWPKGNGVQHITSFRYMAAGTAATDLISAAVVWGQNPAVTEPNQSAVRIGLKNLDLLVVVDMYETETAAVDRKAGGVTYLIPACSHAEEAGSVTNSGRWLQWRERATAPKGNSKSDMELLLRFAYALDKAGAFSHMTDVKYLDDGTVSPVGGVPTAGVWSTLAPKINGPAYQVLYGDLWTPTVGNTAKFEDLTVNTEMWAVGASVAANRDVYGSEVVTEKIYIELCRPLADTGTSGGTMWIYAGGTSAAGYYTTLGDYQPAINGVSWLTKVRAKNRNNTLTGATTNGANNYPRWGWAWLYNRRVFYNQGEVAGDVADVFVAAGTVCCMFTVNKTSTLLADWSLTYRKYKTFKDQPSVATGPHYLSPGLTLSGRFPGHTEPTESPREDLVATWGHNTAAGVALYWEGANPTVPGVVANYPLVLTSIRCVEHFQGGPTTRNNSWNVEAEPVPWIEINSFDARNAKNEAGVPDPIADGDWVNIKTARSDSVSDQQGRTPNTPAGWARGFKARVGVGLDSNQRVGRGVVAIPWHWGDRGLSTGSRANDLCIDAWDANTTIPEYKACLCKISKINV